METAELIFTTHVKSDHITKEAVINCINDALTLKHNDVLEAIKPLLTDKLVTEFIEDYLANWPDAIKTSEYVKGVNDGVTAYRDWFLGR